MKNRLILHTLALMAGLLISSNALAQSPSFWVQDRGQGSCRNVCRANNATPVVSGRYSRNGKEFYICTGNARGEGNRGGYNLEPSWARSCIVGWGGKEIPVNPYECLCQ